MDNRFIVRNQDASRLLPTYEKIVDAMEIPNNGVYILLDDGESPAPPYTSRYSKAFYMNIRSGGIEEMSPDHVLNIMRKPDCEHFIWLSPSVTNGEPFYAAWVLAHEAHHLNQHITYPELEKVGTFLRQAYPALRQDIKLDQLDLPGELDAEIKAKEVSISLFSREAYDDFVDNEGKLGGDKIINYYNKLNTLEKAQPAYKKETLLLLCSWKEKFIEQQEKLNKHKNRFDFDITALCGS